MKNDQCFVEQKNGVVVRQLVGYDRFEGPHAYRQLTELYRAVRLYVNFFPPSMKLRAKTRDGARVSRKYDRAQTPYQRLLAADVLSAADRERLERVHQALDPVRLLRQLEQLQNALWRHAVLGGPLGGRTPQRTPLQVFEHEAMRQELAPPGVGPGDGATGTCRHDPVEGDSLVRQKRKYRRSDKRRVPHTWRTRKDPFEEDWEEVQEWLAAEPEQTAKALFHRLQAQYPDRYGDGQLRTLQRRVKVWRKAALLTFDDGWLEEETQHGAALPGPLRAAPVRESRLGVDLLATAGCANGAGQRNS